MKPTRFSGEARVWTFIAMVGAIAGFLYLRFVADLPELDAPFRLPWYALAGLFFLSEVAIVHLQVERNAQHFTLAEVPLVLGLYFATPQDLVAAQLLGAALALHFYRRQPLLKLSFNLVSYALQASLAAIIFHGFISEATALAPVGWAITFAACMAASLVSLPMVFLAIALSERRFSMRIPGFGIAFAMLVTTANTSMMMLGVTVIWTDPQRLILLLIPTGILFLSYRAYMGQRDRNESLQFLHEATRSVQRSVEADTAILALLEHARSMFRAEISEVMLFSDEEEGVAYRTSLGPGEEADVMKKVDLDPKEGVWARVTAEAQGVLLSRPITNDRLRIHFASQGIAKDVMVAPLIGRDGVVGTVLVGDRLGDVGTFDPEDLRLFETLANHASTALENARLIDRLRESLVHLTEMNRLKDDFVAVVSHELRTPLTSIQGYVKTLLRPDADRLSIDDRRSFLEAADRSSERLRSLIEDLLIVARLEMEDVEPAVSQVGVKSMLESVVEELRDKLSDRDVTIRFEGDVGPVETDPRKAQQIVSNLVENAAKYSTPGGPIEILVAPEGQGATVAVRDGGPGIPVEEQEKIFDRFYQVDQSATRTAGGTGLGLYLCRELAKSVGGRVWLQSSGPSGSTFSLWLPAAAPLSRIKGAPSLDVGAKPEPSPLKES